MAAVHWLRRVRSFPSMRAARGSTPHSAASSKIFRRCPAKSLGRRFSMKPWFAWSMNSGATQKWTRTSVAIIGGRASRICLWAAASSPGESSGRRTAIKWPTSVGNSNSSRWWITLYRRSTRLSVLTTRRRSPIHHRDERTNTNKPLRSADQRLFRRRRLKSYLLRGRRFK